MALFRALRGAVKGRSEKQDGMNLRLGAGSEAQSRYSLVRVMFEAADATARTSDVNTSSRIDVVDDVLNSMATALRSGGIYLVGEAPSSPLEEMMWFFATGDYRILATLDGGSPPKHKRMLDKWRAAAHDFEEREEAKAARRGAYKAPTPRGRDRVAGRYEAAPPRDYGDDDGRGGNYVGAW